MTTELHGRPAAHDGRVPTVGVEPVGLGVVGAGYWGPNFVRNALQSPTMRLVAVCVTRSA